MSLEFVIRAVDDFSDKFDSFEKRIKGISDSANKVGKTLTGIGTAAFAGITGATLAAADFDNKMRNVNTMTRLSEEHFRDLKNEVVELSKRVPESASSLAEGLYTVVSAGVPATEQMYFLETAAKAAAAGLTTTDTAVLGTTSIIKAFGMEFSEVEKVADRMFKTVELGQTTFDELASSIGGVAPTAAAAGVEFDELMTAYATLTGVTGTTSEVTTQLKAALSNIIKPSSQALKLAEELGVEFSQTALETKGLHGFLMDLHEATGGNVDMMAQFFGSTEALNAVLALTGSQADVFVEKFDEMQNATGAMTAAFEEQSNSWAHQWQLLQNNVMDVVMAIGDQFLPTAVEMTEKIADLISRFVEAHPNLTKFAALTMAVVAAVGLTIGPLLLLIGLMPKMVAGVKSVITIVKALGVALRFLALNPVGLIITAIAAAIAIGIALYKNWDKVKENVSKIWNKIKELAASLRDTVISYISELRDRAVERFNALKDAAIEKFLALWNGIKGVFTSFIKGGLIGLINDYILKPFFDIDLFQVGKDIINGLWRGISSMAGTLKRNIENFVNKYVPGPVKKLLGIASPSKLFAKFGEWTIEGFQVGVLSEEGGLVRSMEGIARSVTDVGQRRMTVERVAPTREKTNRRTLHEEREPMPPIHLSVNIDGRVAAEEMIDHINVLLERRRRDYMRAQGER